MKTVCILAMLALPAFGQFGGAQNSFNQSDWVGLSDNVSTLSIHSLRPDGQTGPVTGKPFSAAEVRQTHQTLADGTHVDHTDTSAFYRDAQGRMRSESPRRVLIFDPVGGFTANLNTTAKTYQKYSAGGGADSTSIAVVGDSTWVDTSPHEPPGPAHANGPLPYHTELVRKLTTEDLGSQIVNGIAAKGSRITSTIPARTFGNDREVKIVNERWYSDALQVLVKTVNSDPRFGVTTYDLTNVVQAPPNPALFQVPSEYRLEQRIHHE